MAHEHIIKDMDGVFVINENTRAISNQTAAKKTIIQYDHDSERFTFEMPRYVEGHDMSTCNSVEVHYVNIDSATKAQNVGAYRVTDFLLYGADNNTVRFSWLISRNATMYAGSLNFVVRFACISPEGLTEYAWNTAVYSSVTVSGGMYNGEVILEQHADILGQFMTKEEYNAQRTHWREPAKTNVLTWDGNLDGKDVYYISDTSGYVKVSNDVISVEDILGATLKQSVTGSESETVIANEHITDNRTDAYPRFTFRVNNNESLVVLNDGYSLNTGNETVVFSKGVYFGFYCTTDKNVIVYPMSLTCPTNCFTSSDEWIYHKLAREYLPDDIGGKADWSENNETAAGFVKGRTHYKYIEEVDLVPEMSVEFEQNYGYAQFEVGANGNFALDPEKTYTVYYNGTKYENLKVETYTDNDIGVTWYYIGNGYLVINTLVDNGLPFAYDYFAAAPDSAIVGKTNLHKTTRDAETATFRLTENVEAYEPFDGRYLPKGLGYIIKEGSQTATNTLTWDGNTEGLENIPVSAVTGFYKVTDTAPSISDFVGSTFVVSTPGGEVSFEITEDLIQDGTAEGVPGFMVMSYDGLIAYVFTDKFSQGGLSATKGIYLVHATGDDGAAYVKSITALTDCFISGEATEVKKIDNRLLDVEWLATKTVKETPIWDNVSLDLVYVSENGAAQQILYSGNENYIELVAGKTYSVTLNGVKYENLKAVEAEQGIIVVGDVNEDKTCPFGIVYISGALVVSVYATEDITATFSIAEVDIVYNKLPEGYLPDSVLGDKETEIPEYDITTASMMVYGEAVTTIPIDGSLVDITYANISAIDMALRKGKTIKLTFSLGGVTCSAIVNNAVIRSEYLLFAVTINTQMWGNIMPLVTVAFRLYPVESQFHVSADTVPTASTITALEARIAELEGAAG